MKITSEEFRQGYISNFEDTNLKKKKKQKTR